MSITFEPIGSRWAFYTTTKEPISKAEYERISQQWSHDTNSHPILDYDPTTNEERFFLVKRVQLGDTAVRQIGGDSDPNIYRMPIPIPNIQPIQLSNRNAMIILNLLGLPPAGSMAPDELLQIIMRGLLTSRRVRQWGEWIVDPSRTDTPDHGSMIDAGLSTERVVNVLSEMADMCRGAMEERRSSEENGTRNDVMIQWYN